jgi:hypothetical protein
MVAYRLCIVAVVQKTFHQVAGSHLFQLFDVVIPRSIE